MHPKYAVPFLALFFAAIILSAPFLLEMQESIYGKATTGLKCELQLKQPVSIVTFRSDAKLCIPFAEQEFLLVAKSIGSDYAELMLRPYNEPFLFVEESTQSIDLDGDNQRDLTAVLLQIVPRESATFQMSLRRKQESTHSEEEEKKTEEFPIVQESPAPELPQSTPSAVAYPLPKILSTVPLPTALFLLGGVILLILLVILFTLSLKGKRSKGEERIHQERQRQMISYHSRARGESVSFVRPHTQTQLKHYIQAMRKRGYSDKQIEEELLKAGWKSNYIHPFF